MDTLESLRAQIMASIGGDKQGNNNNNSNNNNNNNQNYRDDRNRDHRDRNDRNGDYRDRTDRDGYHKNGSDSFGHGGRPHINGSWERNGNSDGRSSFNARNNRDSNNRSSDGPRYERDQSNRSYRSHDSARPMGNFPSEHRNDSYPLRRDNRSHRDYDSGRNDNTGNNRRGNYNGDLQLPSGPASMANTNQRVSKPQPMSSDRHNNINYNNNINNNFRNNNNYNNHHNGNNYSNHHNGNNYNNQNYNYNGHDNRRNDYQRQQNDRGVISGSTVSGTFNPKPSSFGSKQTYTQNMGTTFHHNAPLDEVFNFSRVEDWGNVKNMDELAGFYKLDKNSKWDIPADGYENLSVREVKAMGIFSSPDEIIRRNTMFNYKQELPLTVSNNYNRGRQMQRGMNNNNSNNNTEIVNNEQSTEEVLERFFDTEIQKTLVFNFDPINFIEDITSNLIIENNLSKSLPNLEDWKIEIIKESKLKNYIVRFSNKFFADIVLNVHEFKKLENVVTETQTIERPDTYNLEMEKNNKDWSFKRCNNEETLTNPLIKFKSTSSYGNLTLELTFLKNFIDKNKATLNYMFNLPFSPIKPSPVLILHNCIDPVDLKKQETYDKIKKSFEHQKTGLLKGLVRIEISRPALDFIHTNITSTLSNGLGKVFLKFDSIESSLKAFEILQEWEFQNRKIITQFYSLKDFENGIFM